MGLFTVEAKDLREFIELCRGSQIEIRPKILCVGFNPLDPLINVPLVMQLQFVIEFSSDLLGKTLRYVEILAEGVSVEIDSVCYTHKRRFEIGELVKNLKNKANLRVEELTNLFKERDIKVDLYDLNGSVKMAKK
jgi:hypothetical protein